MANAISGLLGTSDGGDELCISSGTADDSTNTTTITIPANETRTVNVTESGAGGLDTGSIAANTIYALYIVKGPAGAVAGVLSTSFTAPTVGSGAKFRRIGSVLTNANSDIVAYNQTGPNANRTVNYNASPNVLRVVNAQSSVPWVDFNLGPPKPHVAGTAELEVVPSGGTTYLRADPGGAEISISTPTTLGFTPPIGSNKGSFRTSTGSSTTIRVTGFTETV